MSIKRIFLPLPASADHRAEIDMALWTAKALSAHVEAVYIEQPPPIPAAARSGASYQYAFVEAGRAVQDSASEPIARQYEEREKGAHRAQEHFMKICAEAAIPHHDARGEVGASPTARWRREEGSYESVTATYGVAFDLIIASSAAIADALKDIAEAALLRIRRPVLLAPLQREGSLTDLVMIAWDASPECWHAVSAALPFLTSARRVEIVTVAKDEASRQASQREVLLYLRCHGIEASARLVRPQSWAIGGSLLALAAEERAGLLVMGAYSHSRWRERLLGGVTRHVLTNATDMPVLMAH